MTDLGPDFIRARNKKGDAVVLHRRDLTDEYTAEPMTADEQAAADKARVQPVLDASIRAHEDASILADNERAAATKLAADERARAEAASIAKRDAAAQAALDQQAVPTDKTEKKAADKPSAGKK